MDERIKNQLLDICIRMFEDLALVKADAYYGTPPKRFVIDCGICEYDDDEDDVSITADLSTYMYEKQKLKSVRSGKQNKTRPISGMYFPEGYALIGTDREEKNAFFVYDLGPDYGRAFRFDILDDGMEKRLGKAELLWEG